jgi:hypothetical protein
MPKSLIHVGRAAKACQRRRIVSNRVPVGIALVLVFTMSCGRPSPSSGGSASTTRLETASPPVSQLPEPRQGGILVEDPTSGHVLLVGGIAPNGSSVASTWSWDGQRWNQLNVLSQGIEAAFFDSVRRQVIALQVAGPAANGTAWWSGTWMSLNSAHVPSPMVFGSGNTVFNPSAKSGLYCGIRNQTSDSTGLETWTWDGNDWSLQSGPSPAKRIDYAFAYDPLTKTDILFGGSIGGGGGPNPNFADTWSWSGSSWTQLQPSHSPPPGDAYAIFDESLNSLVLLDFAGNMWSWTGSDWSAIPSSGSGPGAYRNEAVIGYDPISRRVIVFGGSTGGAVATADTWLWSGGSSSWTHA